MDTLASHTKRATAGPEADHELASKQDHLSVEGHFIQWLSRSLAWGTQLMLSKVQTWSVVLGPLLLIILLIAAPLTAKCDEGTAIHYYCLKYGAGIDFTESKVDWRFSLQWPDTANSSQVYVASAGGEIKDCSSGEFLCKRQQVSSRLERVAPQELIFAVPRVLSRLSHYEILGYKFRVLKFPKYTKWENRVVVIAEPIEESAAAPKYKMVIEPNYGVVSFYFSHVISANPGPGAPLEVREFSDITCSLVSKAGLFSTVSFTKDF
ncbi:MAG: hypothetical protein GC201_12190 [Alphaproteobacteria bacterium]|nr:hypothetical protein [Alphaproteobacteria bacterium]